MARGTVYIDDIDIRATMRALKQADNEIYKQVRREMRDAADIVAKEAASRVPKRSGRAARSLKGAATNRGGAVKGGKGTVPYFGWLDFGSRRPRRGNPRSKGPWHKSGSGPERGRYIYPAIDAKGTEAGEMIDDAIARGIRAAGLEIRREPGPKIDIFEFIENL